MDLVKEHDLPIDLTGSLRVTAAVDIIVHGFVDSPERNTEAHEDVQEDAKEICRLLFLILVMGLRC